MEEVAAGPRAPKFVFITLLALAVVVGFGWLLSLIERQFDFNLYGFTLLFVIPVGAFGCGFVATLGYLAGSRALHVRPGRIDGLLVPVLLAVSTYFVANWFTWQWAFGDAGFSLDGLGEFGRYLDRVITGSGFTIGSGSDASIDRLGIFGYVVVVIELVGFAIGGRSATSILTGQPYCAPSKRFMKKKTATTKYFETGASFHETATAAVDMASNGRNAVLLGIVEAQPDPPKPTDLRLHVAVYTCDRCGAERAVVTAEQRSGKNWQTVLSTATNPPAQSETGGVASLSVSG